MSKTINGSESASTVLCKECGLCCTGYLFLRISLEPFEVETSQAFGLTVLHSGSEKSAYQLPCPLWNGLCTVYSHPSRPSRCVEFKCKLLKEVENGQIELNNAMSIVRRAKEMINNLDRNIPLGGNRNFLMRLTEHVKKLEGSSLSTDASRHFQLEAGSLLVYLMRRFGVTYFFNNHENK